MLKTGYDRLVVTKFVHGADGCPFVVHVAGPLLGKDLIVFLRVQLPEAAAAASPLMSLEVGVRLRVGDFFDPSLLVCKPAL